MSDSDRAYFHKCAEAFDDFMNAQAAPKDGKARSSTDKTSPTIPDPRRNPQRPTDPGRLAIITICEVRNTASHRATPRTCHIRYMHFYGSLHFEPHGLHRTPSHTSYPQPGDNITVVKKPTSGDLKIFRTLDPRPGYGYRFLPSHYIDHFTGGNNCTR